MDRQNESRRANIINFIRAIEPREPSPDLLEPMVKQIELVTKHNLAATWLVQYDTMLDSKFTDILKSLGPDQEIGAWIEMVQPQVEKAGIQWRGRWAWDWHSDVGFAEGYTPHEREKLIDLYMELFQSVFGKLPRTVGCWMLDCHTLNYLSEKYGVIGACNCKDQYGTDGYTLWGGYFAGGYYPSKIHALTPAQHAENQIDIPIFRMLGSDPIYQYESAVTENGQGVVTLEPVYKQGGGDPAWVRWFFDTTFNTPHLALAYAQAGQENSFGWENMADGLIDQFALMAELQNKGTLLVETLESTSEWFRKSFPITPASAVVALDDWMNEGRKSVWYSSDRYRTNLFWDESGFRIRDIHLFDEQYPQNYINDTCTSNLAVYDTLPVMEGFLWSEDECKAGIYIDLPGTQCCKPSEITVTEVGNSLKIQWQCSGQLITVLCEPDRMTVTVNTDQQWSLHMVVGSEGADHIAAMDPASIKMSHEGFAYSTQFECKSLTRESKTLIKAVPDGQSVVISF